MLLPTNSCLGAAYAKFLTGATPAVVQRGILWMVGEELAALIGLLAGAAIGVSAGIVAARRRSLPFPLISALFIVLSAAMAVYGFVKGDLAVFFTGAMLALFFTSPLVWRVGSTALKIVYNTLLIAVPALFIAAAGIEAVPRLTGIMALVGIAVGVANIAMLAKR